MKRNGGTILDFKIREKMELASSLLPCLVFLPLPPVNSGFQTLQVWSSARKDRREGKKGSCLIDTAVSWMLVLFGLSKPLKLTPFLLEFCKFFKDFS